VIIFYLVFKKKNNLIKFKKRNRNRTEIGSNRPVSVRFGFLGQKSVQTSLAWFFRFGSVFFWFGFGLVFLVLGYKTKTKPN
jgi:hypothetical protein